MAEVTMRATPRELRQNRFALLLFVTSQLVPIFVLVNIRFMLVDTYVSARVDPLLGGLIPTVLLIAGAIPTWLAVRSAMTGATGRMRGQLSLAGWIGIVGLVTQIWPLFDHQFDALSPFGEVDLSSVGVGGFFTLVTLIVLFSVVSRARKGLVGPDHYWGVEATAWLYSFNAVAWLVLYVVLFFL